MDMLSGESARNWRNGSFGGINSVYGGPGRGRAPCSHVPPDVHRIRYVYLLMISIPHGLSATEMESEFAARLVVVNRGQCVHVRYIR
jgi:hypothetical protein